MKKIIFIIPFLLCFQKVKAQSIILPELNLATSFYFDQWVLNQIPFL